jgi:tRNA(adenine34) deaminase
MMNQKFNSLDEECMCVALKEAQKAFDANEVPVGAALFLNNKLICKTHNTVFATNDASNHAEILCLKEASKILGDYRLKDAVLYVTLEPCSMCAGAIHNFRIKKVIYGAKDLRVGAAGTLYNLFDDRHPIHKVEIEGGLKEIESAELLRKFFRKKREEKECKNYSMK